MTDYDDITDQAAADAYWGVEPIEPSTEAPLTDAERRQLDIDVAQYNDRFDSED